MAGQAMEGDTERQLAAAAVKPKEDKNSIEHVRKMAARGVLGLWAVRRRQQPLTLLDDRRESEPLVHRQVRAATGALLEEDKEFAERAANAVAKACTYGTDKLQTAVEASDHAWLAEELRVKNF
jgi:hypothetical protein